MNKFSLRKDLQDLLSKHKVDKYTGLHNYMMSEHIIRWIDDYVRQQNVANIWAIDQQLPYYNYMKDGEEADGIQSNIGSHENNTEGKQGDSGVA